MDNQHMPPPGGTPGPLRKKAKNRAISTSKPTKRDTRFTSKRFEHRSPLKRGGKSTPGLGGRY